MEPSASGPEAGGLGELRTESLLRSVEVYLGIAYPSGKIPETVRRRLAWPEGPITGATLAKPPFEKSGRAADGSTPIFALRLGNERYPHMKLQIQPWTNHAGFLLSVNTHDQVAGLDVGTADAQAFRELQAENQRMKEAIESAWEKAGLPTFLQYLREYLASREADLQAGSQ
ncbi:hypothetical protein OJF2_66830 [Aquisphaera giovannonii]|uniref:Uncharacterized protein n=1 Tax=Aquisphaera giovannonii TaxID=406548 RepID=A0A5B9WDE9_9BACT|nr:hypothetical protein [Aquisphaera giovannonii]QEH38085.1 hypothetical protein OJF2_66830 [Aquisphaera giovannonii]